MENKLASLALERNCLSLLLKYNHINADVQHFMSEDAFTDRVHRVIYSLISDSFLNGESVNNASLSQKLVNLNLSTQQEIPIFDYIETLYLSQIQENGSTDSFKELLKLKVLRDLSDASKKVDQYIKTHTHDKVSDIVKNVDTIINKKILDYTKSQRPINLFENIEEVIEEAGNNPPKNIVYGPFPTINRIYGSLLNPGAINLVGARTGIGKTQFGMYYLIYAAKKYNLPILWLDNGEMTSKELQMRSISMFTKGIVPYQAIKSGEWRKNKEWVGLVRDLWKDINKLKVHYHDISAMSPDDIVNFIRRFYYAEIGRAFDFDQTRLLVHYDYLKPFESTDARIPEWKEMGHFIQKVKSLIKNEVPAAVWCSVQVGKSGIVNSRTADQIDDSEGSFTISDRIVQQCTHAWHMRPKTVDELAEEGNRFGNIKLLNVKARELGEDYMGAINPVIFPDGSYRRNYINLVNKSFHYEDRGDLREIVKALSEQYDTSEEGNEAILEGYVKKP